MKLACIVPQKTLAHGLERKAEKESTKIVLL